MESAQLPTNGVDRLHPTDLPRYVETLQDVPVWRMSYLFLPWDWDRDGDVDWHWHWHWKRKRKNKTNPAGRTIPENPVTISSPVRRGISSIFIPSCGACSVICFCLSPAYAKYVLGRNPNLLKLGFLSIRTTHAHSLVSASPYRRSGTRCTIVVLHGHSRASNYSWNGNAVAGA
ncbi:hypothetical protein MBM_04018 [Drepanopeziza brunnea f. sp. 'multigermtubi' MB_m1]|uniref:Uncharacterized protein n=1 Tax=Marssonina brunnea f. sp. multigermtubi (strain MB_m1) TaxID=1072389 RepID=K1XXZ8_MARBU|nr:uncharacterized protein MBM_04018 [Drepanopeziza brunnea f. sp. 'multigermtubi' MB_m1]EKD17649.1 hypothetical protein MBM_04018 [Drepanopeziza brunnea f. sp. 'multigermtubi' MB_m1]